MENRDIAEIPKNIELEQEILTLIIKNDKLMKNIFESVTVKSFYEKNHQTFFTAMLYLYHSNMKIGYSTIIDRLKTLNENSQTIGYLIELGGVHITNGEFEEKVDMLIDLHRKRELYSLYLKRVTTPMSGISSTNLVKEVENKIDGMGISSNIEVEKFEDYVDTWMNDMEDDTPIKSYKLGYKLLDDIVLLEESNLMIIGARPSVGKSAFATNIVKNFCLQGKKPLFVSLEMNKKEYMNRLVSNMAHIPSRKLKRKEHKTPDDWKKIMVAKEKIKTFKFNFYDKGGMKIEQLVGLCEYLKKRGELDVLVIDYLQLLDSNQYKGQKQNQVGYISQKLKQIAMSLSIPVIALSQLSRGSVERGVPRPPELSDLRDSGSLEQDANVVLMLHTTDTQQRFGDGDTRGRFIDLFVRKNRDGKLGHINYEYFGDYIEFKEKEWNDTLKIYEEVYQDKLTFKTFTDELNEMDMDFN